MLSKGDAHLKQVQYGLDSDNGCVIWKSALSVVRSQTRRSDRMPCVVKMIRKANCRKINSVRNLNREITILEKLDHPSIVPMIDHWHEQDYVCMVFQLHQQDLFGLSNGYGNGMPDNYVIQILQSTAEALHYMHRQQVFHRDLKPENILITGEGTDANPYSAVIIDFGISIMGSELDRQGNTRGLVGSPAFYPPEMLNQQSYSPEKADLWSFGCVLLELVVGHIMFKNEWMPCYDRATTGSTVSFLASLQKANSIMLPDQGFYEQGSTSRVKLNHAISSLLEIDPDLRIKPRTLALRFAPDLPVDSFGDNLLQRRTGEASTSDNDDEQRRSSVWGSGSASMAATSVSTVRESTGGDSELGIWLPSLVSPHDRDGDLLDHNQFDDGVLEDDRRRTEVEDGLRADHHIHVSP